MADDEAQIREASREAAAVARRRNARWPRRRSAGPSATGRPSRPPKESGGPSGPEPTRYGDWEKKGLTSDF